MTNEIEDYLDTYGDYDLTTERVTRNTFMSKYEIEEELEAKGYTEVLGWWYKR